MWEMSSKIIRKYSHRFIFEKMAMQPISILMNEGEGYLFPLTILELMWT